MGGHVDVGWILILLASLGVDPDGGTTARLKSERLSLPGGPGPIWMDYLAYDSGTGRLWVPAGNTGQVNVIDTATRVLQIVKGFPTAARGNRELGDRPGRRDSSDLTVLLESVIQCTLYSCSLYTRCIYKSFTPLLRQIKSSTSIQSATCS